MNHDKAKRRPFWLYVFIVLLLVATVGVGCFTAAFTGWSQFEPATSAQAGAEITAELANIADQRPYLTISASGSFEVNRDLEQSEPIKLAALHLVTYDPESERLSRVRFPFWFVRAKLSDRFNLGTLVALFSNDWQQLDIDVTENDLMQRGPGIVLDHTRADGGRILLWSESAK